jgi:hypothetical protein
MDPPRLPLPRVRARLRHRLFFRVGLCGGLRYTTHRYIDLQRQFFVILTLDTVVETALA